MAYIERPSGSASECKPTRSLPLGFPPLPHWGAAQLQTDKPRDRSV